MVDECVAELWRTFGKEGCLSSQSKQVPFAWTSEPQHGDKLSEASVIVMTV